MFSKYDVYTTVQSMYCYPDTDVLINKLDIRDKAKLKQAEEEFTAVKQMALLQEPIKGRFTKTHLFRIHRFLFEDVYPFAGHIRKEQISKGDTMFYPPDLIDRELERVFKNIHSKKLLAEQDEEKQIQNLSQTMAEHVAALRRLFLDELPGMRAGIADPATRAGTLHRLRASCGFVGAARLDAAVQALQESKSEAALQRVLDTLQDTLDQSPSR